MKQSLAVILLLILFSACVHGQDLRFGGGVRTSLLSYNHDELDTGTTFWGGHARIRALKFLAGEFSIQKRKDEFQIGNGSITLDTVPMQLSAIVYPLGMFPITPVLLGGTGWYHLKATVRGDLGLPFVFGEGSITVNETAPHIGVGVEAFIGRHFSAGVDVRKVFLEFNTDIIDYKFDAYFVNIAATFYF